MLKIRFWPALVVCLVVLLAVRLGFWQRDRAHQKEALAERIGRFEHATPLPLDGRPLALRAVEYHRVRARGQYLPEQVVYLENRPHNDAPGFYVVMPLKLEHGGAVLVNRGWLPRNQADRTAIAPYSTPVGMVEVEGIARATPPRTFELGHAAPAPVKIRQNVDPQAYARETGLPLEPFVIQQTSAVSDGLVRDWPAPDTGVERNYGYMVQWWGIAAAALGFGLYVAWRAAHPAGGRRGGNGPAPRA